MRSAMSVLTARLFGHREAEVLVDDEQLEPVEVLDEVVAVQVVAGVGGVDLLLRRRSRRASSGPGRPAR